MIEPNYNGYLFKNNDEFKDYIFKLMNDDKLYKEMSINARNSIYKYSKEVFASDILKVYHKAIKGHNKTSED
jgi:glycosyltransferase involved in cell wall biosynthesis